MFSRNAGAATLHGITTRKLEVGVFCPFFCLFCGFSVLTYRDGSDAGSLAQELGATGLCRPRVICLILVVCPFTGFRDFKCYSDVCVLS